MYFRAELTSGRLNSVTVGGAAFQPYWGWVTSLGHSLISDYYLEIGGTQIDKQYGDWLNVWYELTHKIGQERGYAVMIGNVPAMTQLATTPNGNNNYVLNVPLQFFHCRHDGLGLPLIALQYHEVRVTFDINALNNLIVTNYAAGSTTWAIQPSISTASLWVDYVYLDQEERKRFAQATHEYLIEQVQFPSPESITSTNTRTRLSFNHPCKFILWNVQLGRYTSGLRFLGYNAESAAATQLLATKRFILGWCDIGSNNILLNSDGTVKPKASLTGAYLAYFTAAKALVVDVFIFDVDNVTITGALLPIDVASLDAATFENSAAGRNTLATVASNQGAAAFDYVVYQWDNYGLQLDRSENPTQTGLLQLNGHDRFNVREGDYFNYVQPYQCFSNTPSDGVNVYSFALTPEEHQPSGTCNFSRIDNATLALSLGRAAGVTNTGGTFSSVYLAQNSNLNIYAFNYNVLRVMSGMAGLALMIISIELKSIMLVALVLYYQTKHLESQLSF
jgi:hypothetical protein